MMMLLSNLASDFMSYLIVHVSHVLLVLFLLKMRLLLFICCSNFVTICSFNYSFRLLLIN